MNLEEKKVQKQMAEKLLEASEDKVNRNIKDSVFCNLFGEKEYLYQLYQVLNPEDKESGPEDLTIITLSRTIVQCIYNDLGFLVGNRLIVLVEAQSTWSENILVRFLMYLGETYRRYIRTNGLRLYNEKNIEIPRPELYVVFTGTEEGKITGARDQMEEDAKGMYAEGIRPEVIARIQKVSVDVIEKILGLLPV